MHSTRKVIFSVAAALLMGLAAAQAAPIQSTFDLDDEGWSRAPGHDPNATITWLATGGNPDGHIRYNEPGEGAWDYFSAPAQFLGNKAGYYGGQISYDLRVNATANQVNDDLILLGGGLTMVYRFGSNPTTSWQTFTIDLDESAGWRLGSWAGSAPTQAQFLTLLGDLTALRIRADYIGGSEQVFLDNVTLVPEPGALALLGLGAPLLLRRGRRYPSRR